MFKIRPTVLLTSCEGEKRRIDFHPVETTDRAVLYRMESVGDPKERVVLTTFRPASQRPASYPPGLPFVRKVKTSTHEFPGSNHPPSASWAVLLRSAKALEIFNEVVRQSLEAGWVLEENIDLAFLTRALRKALLRRSDYVRVISQHGRSWFASVVGLLEIPSREVDGLKK